MDQEPITMSEGGLYHDPEANIRKMIARAHAAREREKHELEEIMEEAHKAGRKPFDLMEFLDYYRCHFNELPSKEDVLSGKVSEETFFSFKWDYYVRFPEMASSKELAVYYNQQEMRGMY